MTFRNLLYLLTLVATVVWSGTGSPATAQESIRVIQSHNIPVSQLMPQVERQLLDGGYSVRISSGSAQNTILIEGSRTEVDAALAIVRQLDRSATEVTPAASTKPVPAPTALTATANGNPTKVNPTGRSAAVATETGRIIPVRATATIAPLAALRPVNEETVTSDTIFLRRTDGEALMERLGVIFGSQFISLDLNLYALRSASQQESIQITLDALRQSVKVAGPRRLVKQFRQLVEALEVSNDGSINTRTLIVRFGSIDPQTSASDEGWISSRVRVIHTVNASGSKLRQAVEAYRTGEVPPLDGDKSISAATHGAASVATNRGSGDERLRQAQQYAVAARNGGMVRPVSYEAEVDDFGGPVTVPATSALIPISAPSNGADGGMLDGGLSNYSESTIPANVPDSGVRVAEIGNSGGNGIASGAGTGHMPVISSHGTMAGFIRDGEAVHTSRLPEGFSVGSLNEQLNQIGLGVEIQENEPLGVLIVRGPQEDVAAVIRIIETIEQLSAATEPEIVIYRLQNQSVQAVYAILSENSVQEAVILNRPGKVSMIPIVRPNGFLLLGWGESLDRMLAFLEKIDMPEDPQIDQRIFQIRNAPVDTIYQLIMGYFGAESGGMGAQVRLLSDQRTNQLVVHAAPRDMEIVETLIKNLDVNETASKMKTKIFKLRNVLVNDMYSTLQQMINNSRGATTTGAASRPSGADFVKKDGTVESAGLGLGDVRLTTDQRLNLLIVSAPDDAMPLVEEMVRMLDADDSISVAQIKIFQIQNSDCQRIVTMLQTLLPSDMASSGVKLAVAAEGEPSLIGLRFASDVRTNSVIAIGSETDLNVVDALISRLDTENFIERKTAVYQLRNQKAVDMAMAVNEFLDAQQTLRAAESAAAGGDSPSSLLEEQVIVVPEPMRDVLIVSASPRYLDMIEQLIDRLDADIPEVMIQVLIAEVALNNTEEFGIEWGIQDSVLFDRSVVSGGGLVPGPNFNSSLPLGSDPNANYANLGGQALSSFGLGRSSSQAGFGGMVLSMSNQSVSMLLRALAMQQRIEVQARPMIQTRNNKQAYILIGSQVMRPSGTTLGVGMSQTNNRDVVVGTVIVVQPRIDDTDRVVISVEAEKSKIGAADKGTVIGYSAEGQPIIVPPIDTIQAVTEVAAYDGQTTILGGLITREITKGEKKVPWLGDVPLVGNLFKFQYDYMFRTELMIILTPHIVKTADDLARLKRIESSRMHWCLEDVREIHGNPDGITSHGGNPETIYADGGLVMSGTTTTVSGTTTTNGTTRGATTGGTTGVTRAADVKRETSDSRVPVTLESRKDFESGHVPVKVSDSSVSSTDSITGVSLRSADGLSIPRSRETVETTDGGNTIIRIEQLD